jgi:hypothetical protein
LTDKDLFADELSYGNLELIAILPDKTEFTTPVIDDKGEPEADQRVFPDMMRVLLRDHNAVALRTKMTDDKNVVRLRSHLVGACFFRRSVAGSRAIRNEGGWCQSHGIRFKQTLQ